MNIRCLVGAGYGIKMVRDRVQWNPGLMIFWIKKIFEKLGTPGGRRQAHSEEFHLWIDLEHGGDYCIVNASVSLRGDGVFILWLVQHLQIVDLEMMTGIVATADFVGEPAEGIPAHQPGVVIAYFFQAGIAEFSSLLVTPAHFVRIGR